MILGLRTYNVSPHARAPLLAFMLDGLRAAGCRVIAHSPATSAPFVISFEAPDGERMGVVAYAFLATRTPTRNRPDDERSFQIKYGSKAADPDENEHALWQDPLGLFTTLLIGIDPEGSFYVSADAEHHNPTKFFIRVEFKDEHAEAIEAQGWHAWERSRRGGAMEEPVEVLVGGRRDTFLDLVRFERAAHGLSPGDRQLLAERRGIMDEVPLAADAAPVTDLVSHPLLRELQLDAGQVLELISTARRLKMAVRGWVAEQHLQDRLTGVAGMDECTRLDVEGGADILLRYRGGPPLTMECKNVLREKNKTRDLPRIDFQRTRAAKNDPCSRYYSPFDFNLVAGCLHAVTSEWEFRYTLPSRMDAHLRCEGKLASNVLVDERWTADPVVAITAAYGGR